VLLVSQRALYLRETLDLSLREVEKDLRQIKGIGDKRIEEIMAVIEKHLGV